MHKICYYEYNKNVEMTANNNFLPNTIEKLQIFKKYFVLTCRFKSKQNTSKCQIILLFSHVNTFFSYYCFYSTDILIAFRKIKIYKMHSHPVLCNTP